MLKEAVPLAPVEGNITLNGGEFGVERKGNTTGGHNGIDYAVPIGTPVKAPLDGEVIRANFARPHANDQDGRSYGWIIVLYHGQNALTNKYTYTVYAHLSPIVLNPLVGDRIKAGEEFARSGNSGNVKPHLHFETIESPEKLTNDTRGIEYNAHRVNPVFFLARTFYFNDYDSFEWTEENIKKIKEHLDFQEIRRNKRIVGYNVLLCGKMLGYLGNQPGSALNVRFPAKEMLKLVCSRPVPTRWSQVKNYEIKLPH